MLIGKSFKTKTILLLLTYFSNLTFIYFYGVDIPFWDQWDSEANLYIAYESNTLTLNEFFIPHNEHRIVLTKFFNLLIFILNNGWSPKLGMYIQASLLICTVSVWIHFVGINSKNSLKYTLSIVLSSIIISLPYYWESILWSFMNSYYFMILLSFIAHVLYLKRMNLSVLLLLILLQSLLILNITSGILCIFTTLGLSIYFSIKLKSKRYLYNILISFQLFLVFLQYKIWVVIPDHNKYRISDLSELIEAVEKIFSWPFPSEIFSYLIFLILLYSILSKLVFSWNTKSISNYFIVLNALFVWISLQLFAIAYGRGNSYVYSSRYLLFYSLFFLVFIEYISFLLKNINFAPKFILSISALYVVFLFQFTFSESIHLMNLHSGKRMEAKLLLEKSKNLNSIELRNISGELHPDPNRVYQVIMNPYLKPFHKWYTF